MVRPAENRLSGDLADTGDGMAVAPIAVPDHPVRYLLPRERICELTGAPLRCRMIGDAQRDQPSPLVPQSD